LRVSIVPINFSGGMDIVPYYASDVDGEGRRVELPAVAGDLLRLYGEDEDVSIGEGHDPNTTESPSSSTSSMLPVLRSKLGGLESQLSTIVRRIYPLKNLSPSTVTLLSDLNLRPPKGILLYGPPGCGKTALARALSEVLTLRKPVIVNAPELLSRWVGGSERLVRDLFGAAVEEYNDKGKDSALHVVIIDEVDAAFRVRGGEGDGSMARDSTVNQMLGILDGVKEIPNVLVVGMTNRPKLLDPALLRNGRLEVKVEVPMPDREGRRDIGVICFKSLREAGRLTRGVEELVFGEGTRQGWRSRKLGLGDLTKGFSGADIDGLVRSATSFALDRDGGEFVVSEVDVRRALKEVKGEL